MPTIYKIFNPISIKFNILLQNLAKAALKWDEPLQGELAKEAGAMLEEAGSKGEIHSCRLLLGKARVTPSSKIKERLRRATPQTSPPRGEGLFRTCKLAVSGRVGPLQEEGEREAHPGGRPVTTARIRCYSNGTTSWSCVTDLLRW